MQKLHYLTNFSDRILEMTPPPLYFANSVKCNFIDAFTSCCIDFMLLTISLFIMVSYRFILKLYQAQKHFLAVVIETRTQNELQLTGSEEVNNTSTLPRGINEAQLHQNSSQNNDKRIKQAQIAIYIPATSYLRKKFENNKRKIQKLRIINFR